ncbi:MAG: glycosyltransferase [Candidatus Diapherotrites archaeon]|nr:glycosyltransferase [Candidatus Diapherotrites archaeon]
MIFVSVGTHKQQFNRLLTKVNELIKKGIIKDSVFAQTGYSNYTPKYYKHEKFLGIHEFDKKIRDCDIFITHAGEGNIGTALQFEKKMVIIPRLTKFREHTNNHQIELAKAIKNSKQGIVSTVEELEDSLKKAAKLKIKKTEHAKGIIKILNESRIFE